MIGRCLGMAWLSLWVLACSESQRLPVQVAPETQEGLGVDTQGPSRAAVVSG